MNAGTLYVVATPIGHLGDITQRAIDVLSTVDWIAAEDTRHSRTLLAHYGIKTPMLSLHAHNEQARAETVISRLQQGQSIALISDAGTPLISDPGYRLVAKLHELGLPVVPLPGPCAAICALSAAGLPTDGFVFVGFLPSKGAMRHKQLQTFSHETRTLIFYEARHRVVDLLKRMVEVFGAARLATVARELTKTFETIRQGTLDELVEWIESDPNQQRGEFVVLVQGAEKAEKARAEEQVELLHILLDALSLKQAVALAVKITGAPKKDLYQLALNLQSKNQEST